MFALAALGVVLLATGLLATKLFAQKIKGVEGWSSYEEPSARQSDRDLEASQRFLASGSDDERYGELFRYFVQGAVEYQSGASIHYPGFSSTRGYRTSGVEGFARIAPMLGAWVYSGRPNHLNLSDDADREVDLVAFLRDAALKGTDPEEATYWGDMEFNGQRIVEAPDIARMLGLTRDDIWEKLSAEEQTQIANWLQQANPDNFSNSSNWLLFPTVIEAFLKSVDRIEMVDLRTYEEFKRGSYRQQGWYSDGQQGEVDYYNTWGISYDLFWIHLMDPSIDAEFLDSSLVEAGELTAHLISPRGIPIMGRSLCYRTAVPSPVIAASLLAPDKVAPGLGRRALDATWQHFVSEGALKSGSLTMGYYGDDPRLVDYYTGPGSCHWGLRSLTLAFMSGPQSSFWQSDLEPLPVERENYEKVLPKLGWKIVGHSKSLDIEIEIIGNTLEDARLDPYLDWRPAAEWLFERPVRPANNEVKYGLRSYSALRPLGGNIGGASGR